MRSDAVLGGYHDFGKSATATKVVDLGSEGNGVVVAFTFLKLDSWDSEYARLYADDVLVWNEQMYASSGANLCGCELFRIRDTHGPCSSRCMV